MRSSRSSGLVGDGHIPEAVAQVPEAVGGRGHFGGDGGFRLERDGGRFFRRVRCGGLAVGRLRRCLPAQHRQGGVDQIVGFPGAQLADERGDLGSLVIGQGAHRQAVLRLGGGRGVGIPFRWQDRRLFACGRFLGGGGPAAGWAGWDWRRSPTVP